MCCVWVDVSVPTLDQCFLWSVCFCLHLSLFWRGLSVAHSSCCLKCSSYWYLKWESQGEKKPRGRQLISLVPSNVFHRHTVAHHNPHNKKTKKEDFEKMLHAALFSQIWKQGVMDISQWTGMICNCGQIWPSRPLSKNEHVDLHGSCLQPPA